MKLFWAVVQVSESFMFPRWFQYAAKVDNYYLKCQSWSLRPFSRDLSHQLNEIEVEKWLLVFLDSHFLFNLANPKRIYWKILFANISCKSPALSLCLWVCTILEPIVMAKGLENTNGPVLGRVPGEEITWMEPNGLWVGRGKQFSPQRHM